MVKKIINDVEIVVHYLHQAEEFLELRNEVIAPEGEVEMKIEEEMFTSDRVLKKGLEPDDDFGKVITEEKVIDIATNPLPDENVIGYILPLNCGISGMLNLNELNIYQKHLVNAQIVELEESP